MAKIALISTLVIVIIIVLSACGRKKLEKKVKHGHFTVKYFKKSVGYMQSDNKFEEIFIDNNKYILPRYIKNNSYANINDTKYFKNEDEYSLLFYLYNDLAEQAGWHLLFLQNKKPVIKYLGKLDFNDNLNQNRYLTINKYCEIDVFTGELRKLNLTDSTDYQCVLPLEHLTKVITYYSLKDALKNPLEVNTLEARNI